MTHADFKFKNYNPISSQTNRVDNGMLVPVRTSVGLRRCNELWIVSSEGCCGYVEHRDCSRFERWSRSVTKARQQNVS